MRKPFHLVVDGVVQARFRYITEAIKYAKDILEVGTFTVMDTERGTHADYVKGKIVKGSNKNPNPTIVGKSPKMDDSGNAPGTPDTTLGPDTISPEGEIIEDV